tara:strand:- start:562 stop:1329 length:768 start_codon:yes stop_codon:yes gene_type:complete
MINVSVIVTTYNRPIFLKETIESILNQTYKSFELIIVDNNSNYDFFKLIKSFDDPRISAYQNNNDGIIAKNRNYGIGKAVGNYIAFCDDDDIWLSNKLAIQMKEIKKSLFDIIYSNATLFYKTKENRNTNYSSKTTLNSLLNMNPVMLSTVLVKNSPFVVFNESSEIIAIEDYDLWIRLKINGYRFKLIKEPLVLWRVSDNSVSNKSKSINEKRNINYRINIIRNFELNFLSKLVLVNIIFKRSIKYLLFKIIGK